MRFEQGEWIHWLQWVNIVELSVPSVPRGWWHEHGRQHLGEGVERMVRGGGLRTGTVRRTLRRQCMPGMKIDGYCSVLRRRCEYANVLEGSRSGGLPAPRV